MARTGSFGRAPRSLPSLTSTIVGITREQESTRDQNIMSAWQAGGMFEGKKVTDEVMLDHWRARLKDIDKKDPLYDTYKNAILQYEYSIAESKMTVQLAQGKISPGQAAQFYLGWAKRIPRASEFYRILQRDAAQLMKQQAAANRAGAAARAEAAYQTSLTGLEKKWEKPAQFAEFLITNLTQQGTGRTAGSQGGGGFMGNTHVFIDKDALSQATGTLDTFNLPSYEQLEFLIRQVDQKPLTLARRTGKNEPIPMSDNFLFMDDTGKKWSQSMVAERFAATDPNYRGFSIDYSAELTDNQILGLKKKQKLARESGHASDAAQYQDQIAAAYDFKANLAANNVLDEYADIKREQERLKDDKTMFPGLRDAELTALLGRIGALAADPSISTNGALRSKLIGESKLQLGMTTAYEDINGTKVAPMTNNATFEEYTSSTASEIGSMKTFMDNDKAVIAALSEPGVYLTQGRFVDDASQPGGRRFTVIAGAPEWGPTPPPVIDPATGESRTDSSMADAIPVQMPTGDGKTFTPVMLVPQKLYGTADKAALKARGITATGLDQPLGVYIQTYADGKMVTLWQYDKPGPGGGHFYEETPPVSLRNGTQIVFNQGNATVDATAMILSQADIADSSVNPSKVGGDYQPGGLRGWNISGRSPMTAGQKYANKPGFEDTGEGAFAARFGLDYSAPVGVPPGMQAPARGSSTVNVADMLSDESTHRAGFVPGASFPSATKAIWAATPNFDKYITIAKGMPEMDKFFEGAAALDHGGEWNPETNSYEFASAEAEASFNTAMDSESRISAPGFFPGKAFDDEIQNWKGPAAPVPGYSPSASPYGPGNAGAWTPLPSDIINANSTEAQRFAPLAQGLNGNRIRPDAYTPVPLDQRVPPAISLANTIKVPAFDPVSIPAPPTYSPTTGFKVPKMTTQPTRSAASVRQTNSYLGSGKIRGTY